jgi:altronate dehydratase
LIDLANEVAHCVAQAVPDTVALLTPAGGLSFGEEARLIHRLRWRLARHANVAGVVVIGPTPPDDAELVQLVGMGRPVEAIPLLRERDVRSAVGRGVVWRRECWPPLI